MAKNRLMLLAVLVSAGLSVVTLIVLHSREPIYRGRTMGSWLKSSLRSGMETDPEMEEQVWTSFGSNAVPFLRKALDARDGPFDKTYCALCRHLPDWIKSHLVYDPPPGAIIRWRAADGLGFMGKSAASAIPDLIRLSKTDQAGLISKGFVRGRAVAALGNIGQNLKPSDPSYQAVTKALIEALNDADAEVRSIAANSLRLQYPEAAAKAGIK